MTCCQIFVQMKVYSESAHINIQFFIISPFLNIEIPELLDDLRSVMKDYVLLDTKYKDLKTSKQKVIQLCTEKVKKDIAEGRESSITLDEINEVRCYLNLLIMEAQLNKF